jgi:hypothetical protein
MPRCGDRGARSVQTVRRGDAIVRAVGAEREIARAVAHAAPPDVPRIDVTPPPHDARRRGDDVRRRERSVAFRVPLAGHGRSYGREAIRNGNAPVRAERAPGAVCSIVRLRPPPMIGAERALPPDAPSGPRGELGGVEAAVGFGVPLSNQVGKTVHPVLRLRLRRRACVHVRAPALVQRECHGQKRCAGHFCAAPGALSARAHPRIPH